MQANPRSLDTLFNSQLRYIVPMFQRLYVWKETPQWSTLWEDVSEKANLLMTGVKSNPHYLGALIIEGVKPNTPREVKRFLIIDGQQRLTTLQLMFCAFRDIARKNDWKILDRTVTRYLENADADVMEHPEEEIFKLWPTALNRDAFRSVLLAGSLEEVNKRHPLIYLPRKRKPQPRSNLAEGYLFFSKSISAWLDHVSTEFAKSREEAASTLLQSLQQDFCVVEISLSEGDDSQEIFYSLNSQGQPLSQSDLLRSLIFMRAEKEQVDRDEIFSTYWSKFETNFWSTEVSRGGRAYSRLDLGLRFFLMAKTGFLIDARRVNEEYRRWVGSSPPRYPTVKDELEDFTKHSEVYQRYESSVSAELPCTDLRRVLKDFDVSTALPLVMFLELEAGLNPEQVKDCLGAVESFIARRVLTGEETKEYNKLFVDIIGSLRGLFGAEILPTLCDKLLEGGGVTRHWPTDGEVIEKAISRPVFKEIKTAALRLILERLEVSFRTKKSENLDIPAGLQIEHVMPQSWDAHWMLKGILVPNEVARYPHLAKGDLEHLGDAVRLRKSTLQTLGNLTLLNKYLNPAASNGSFQSKLVEYRNSVLRLNRYFDVTNEWNEDQIVKRGTALGEQICKIWPRPSHSGK